MKIKYINWNPNAETIATINDCNTIIARYAEQGLSLTSRQLYYRLVATGKIGENAKRQYDRLKSIVSKARQAGLISWYAIEDRTRSTRKNSHWDGPSSVLRAARAAFAIDKWADQEYRPTVWIEKDALIGVLEKVCAELDVPYTSCRGYTSQSYIWRAARLMREQIDAGQSPVVIHLGDHDPSGMDMTSDIRNRLSLFTEAPKSQWTVERIALNMNQIDEYNPPPNWAKESDSRSVEYVRLYGRESWELDALSPEQIIDLVEHAVLSYRDDRIWQCSVDRENDMLDVLDGMIESARRYEESL